ncbi:PucR family transcriptional regulator [Actinokineospora guangxiensis]|uniref:PucR family transcriptional regulator n=1 Tax=Actinokineospora guangxiensis TaxID=1490288 RepID=A0ABW0EV86_9PSEU
MLFVDPPEAAVRMDISESDPVASRAAREIPGVAPDLVTGFAEVLATVSRTRGPIGEDHLRSRAEAGARAARQGVPMSEVIDLHLRVTRLAWSQLPGVREASSAGQVRLCGEAVLRAQDAAVMAVAEGYQSAQRWSVRQEEAFRREFVDDLLDGRNLGDLAERAERFGVRLAGSTVVTAVRADLPLVDGGDVVRAVVSALHVRPLYRDVLVTTKNGLLVCVAPGTTRGVVEEFVHRVGAAMPAHVGWSAGIGDRQAGPGGVVRSFEQARAALDIAERLGLPGRTHRAGDLLVYQVLSRDSAALADLISVVLLPLRTVRGGPGPLVDTLAAYFAAGQVTAACARQLNVGVRTVTYRLSRVRDLTGYSVDDPAQALSLHIAVLGVKLLGWPTGDMSGFPPSLPESGNHRPPDSA